MKKKLRPSMNIINSCAIFKVLKFLDLETAVTYQLLNKRFYDKTIPMYINMMKIKRTTCFYRFVYSRKKVQTFDLYTLEWSSKNLAKKGWNNLVDNCQVIQTEKCRIFLVGGFFSNNNYSRRLSEYLPKENLLVERT